MSVDFHDTHDSRPTFMTFIFSVFSFPAPQLMQSISDKPKKRFLGTILYDDAFFFLAREVFSSRVWRWHRAEVGKNFFS